MDVFGARRVPYLARRNYLEEMRHILAWGAVAGMVEGNLAAVVVAKTFGGGAVLINIAATTPVAAYLASLLWGTLCIGRPKIRIFTLCTTGVVLMTGSVAAAPLGKWGGWLFVTQMAAAQFFMAGAITVRSAVWKSNYPQAVRGQLAGRIQIVRAFTRVAAVAVVAKLFDADPASYRWVYPAVAVIGFVSIYFLRRIHVRGEEGELKRLHGGARGATGRLVGHSRVGDVLSPRHLLAGAVRVLRCDAHFRRYCTALMLAGCANLTVRAVAVTVIATELLVDMPGEYWLSAVLLEVLPMCVLLLSMGRFARFFDRVGVLRFRVAHAVCWMLALVLGLCGSLAVAYRERLGPAYVVVAVACFTLFTMVRGAAYAGGSIAWNLGHLYFARPEDAEVYMGIHVSLTGLRGLVLPALGTLLWTVVGWWVWVVSVCFSLAALASFWALARGERVRPLGAAEMRVPENESTGPRSHATIRR